MAVGECQGEGMPNETSLGRSERETVSGGFNPSKWPLPSKMAESVGVWLIFVKIAREAICYAIGMTRRHFASAPPP